MAKKAKKKYELAVPQWAKPAVKFIKKSTEPIVNAVMNSPQVKIIVNAVPKVVSPPPKSKRGESKKLPVTPKTVQPAKSAPVKKKDSPKREAKGMTWRNIKPGDSGNAAQVNLQNKENSNNIKLSWEETVQMYVDDIRKGETHSGALRTLTLTSDPILSQLNNALNLSKIISSVADVSGVKGYYNNTVKSVEESFNDTGNQVYNSKIPFVSNFVGAFTNSSDYRKNGPLPLETEAENKLLAGLNYLYFSKFGGGILNHADPLTTYNSIKDNTNMASVIGANMGGAFINGGAKMADGMANMCLDPYGTIEGMLHMASNPKETLQSVSKSIETFSFHMVNADSQEKARLQGTLLFDVASIVMLSKLGKGAEGAKEAQGANKAGGLVKRGVSINKTEAEMANASRGAGGPGVAEGTGNIQKTLSKRVEEIRQQMPNSKLRNQGNMATANVDVPGIKKDFVAHSQINNSTSKGADLGDFSYLKPESERMFKTYVEAGKPGAEYSRFHDTEVKILEDIASQIDNPNIHGTINLYTEAPACQSCTNVIFEFRRTFPNIKLNIYAGE